jgi:hypothetical protein
VHIDGRLIRPRGTIQFVNIDPVIRLGPGIWNTDEAGGIACVPDFAVRFEKAVHGLAGLFDGRGGLLPGMFANGHHRGDYHAPVFVRALFLPAHRKMPACTERMHRNRDIPSVLAGDGRVCRVALRDGLLEIRLALEGLPSGAAVAQRLPFPSEIPLRSLRGEFEHNERLHGMHEGAPGNLSPVGGY